MADIKNALFDHLTADDGVSAIVDDRVYPNIAEPKAALPFITFQSIVTRPVRHLGGSSGIRDATIQIDSWAKSSPGATALAEAVVAALKPFGEAPGDMGTPVVSVRGVFLDSERESANMATDENEDVIFRVTQTYSVWYRE